MKKLWILILIGVSVLFLTPSSFAQTEKMDDLFNLMKTVTVVTPTSKPTPIRLTPGSVSVVSAEQIENFGFSSIFDALRLVPGADVTYSQMMPKVGVRSIGESPFSEKMNFLIDGISYNSPDKGGFPQHPGYYLSFFPVEMIKQIEVIRGPSSAQWGNFAFWGVVNMVTKDVEGLQFNMKEGETGSQKYSMLYGINEDDYGLSMIVNFEKFEEGPVQIYSDLDNEGTDIYARARYKNFTFKSFNNFSKVGTWEHNLPNWPPRFETKKGKNQVHLAEISHKKELTDNLQLRSSLGFNTRRGSNCGSCHNPQDIGPTGADEGETYQQYIGKLALDYSLTQNHNIVTGVEVQHMNERMHENSNLSRDNELNVSGLSVFVQDEIKWLEKENLITTIGARYEYEEKDGQKDIVNPKFSVVYLPFEELVLRSSFSSGIRFPVTHDREIAMPMTPAVSAVFFGNPDLKPERIAMTEVGGEYFFTKNLSAKVDFFVSEVKDAIMLDVFAIDPPPPSIFSNPDRMFGGVLEGSWTYENNPNKFWISGGEFELHSVLLENKLHAVFAFSHQEVGGKTSGSGTPPPEAPKNKYKIGLTYTPTKNFKSSLFASYRDDTWPGKRWCEDTADAAAFGNPCNPSNRHTLLDAKVDWIIPMKNSKATLSFIGKNLLNFTNQTYFYPGAPPQNFYDSSLVGRTVYVKTTVDF